MWINKVEEGGDIERKLNRLGKVMVEEKKYVVMN
jgi:hypothetical protein